MLNPKKADDLVHIARKQLSQGLDAKIKRMKQIASYYDLYNNKIVELDEDVFNIPFPYLAGHIDLYLSKIDNPPTLNFKIPNKPTLSDKIKAAWTQEMSSSRSGWKRKDRAEKKMALLSGRGVSKIYASSVLNKYKSHYDLVDVYSFIADPTRGRLEDGNYHGETDIFKTHASLKEGADAGFYDKVQVKKLLDRKDSERDGNEDVIQNKFDRIKALGVDIEKTSFAGQKGVNMTEWVMRVDNEWFYLLFDPSSGVWIRADKIEEVFDSKKTPFVSWATHYDEYAFWSKSTSDDFYPIAEGMRFLLNNALENEKRRTRPMRLVESGSLVDVNELMDYIPDNVILTRKGQNPNMVTLETPNASMTIDVVQYLDNLAQSKTGVQEVGVGEKDAKVGVFFGQLQQEADRIGVINKEYSESYADKGYNFFWGLKQHLTRPKQVEMLGKAGMKLQQLSKMDMADVDDVDDVIVSGGNKDSELDAIEMERQANVIKELTGAYPDKLNATFVIRDSMRKAGYEDDDIQEALDIEGTINRELMEEADQAIQEIILGKSPDLNHGADDLFLQRILNFVRDEVNYIKLDKQGQVTGIDKKKKDLNDRLMMYMLAHQEIVVRNTMRKAQKFYARQQVKQLELKGEQPPSPAVDVPPPTQREEQVSIARPFENPIGTQGGTQAASARISETLSP
jgi:hypothetical protein|tara:strand:- start:212 stop:2254 length:2043 start_codon:yes stop_codon:yes gene_type:complete